MRDFLIVVDMQRDFIDGALGTPEAGAAVAKVRERIDGFEGEVIFTRDTHGADYLQTQEGRRLPVPHCIRGEEGWRISSALPEEKAYAIVDKPGFGSVELGEMLRGENEKEPVGSITLVGVCTDICVISNAILLKAFLPETEIRVDASCCAGVTPERHRTALEAMKSCQIDVF